MKNKKIKNVFITGGAKRIGACIAEHLARMNCNIIIHYNKSESAAQTLSKKLKSNGKNVHCVKANLTNTKEIKLAFEKAVKKFGYIDCLINNASTFEYDNLKSLDYKSWQKHISANLTAPMILSKLFNYHLNKKKGDIINIIDQRVLNLTPHFLSYTISKSGLWTLTQTLALELAPKIKVNAIGPGPVIKSKFQTEKQFSKQCGSMPLKIGSNPSEVAQTVIYLLSIPSITGQLITLDGGQHLGWGQVKNNNSIKD